MATGCQNSGPMLYRLPEKGNLTNTIIDRPDQLPRSGR